MFKCIHMSGKLEMTKLYVLLLRTKINSTHSISQEILQSSISSRQVSHVLKVLVSFLSSSAE